MILLPPVGPLDISRRRYDKLEYLEIDSMKKQAVLLLILTLLPVVLWAKASYVATVHPIAVILQEIVGDKGTVIRLIPPGASPHTYEPKPSDMKLTSSAQAFFYVSPALDGWAAKLPAKKSIQMIQLLPAAYQMKFVEHDDADGHTHAGDVIDPHFWTNPQAVKAILPGLVKELSKVDPSNAAVFKKNADAFAIQLDSLDLEIQKTIAPVKGRAVFLFHPSFMYFIQRYGLVFGGVIEPFPGKEPTPRYIMDLIKQLRQYKTNAIFIEPQLNRRPADIIAESAKLKVYTMDPNGGVPGRMSYAELIRYNAGVLATALK